MMAGVTVAGVFNANGGLAGGRAARFEDFHPEHALDDAIAMEEMVNQDPNDFMAMFGHLAKMND